MVGAVLHQEMLLGGRRNRLHVFRWLYAGWLVLVVFFLFVQFMQEELAVASARVFSDLGATDHHASAPQVVGNRFAASFVWQQLLLLFLAAPIFAAGAIVDEKRQGTLTYLLLSEMEVRQLLVGKLLGRLAQVILWLMAGLPLFALMAGYGGIEPITIAFLYAGLLMPALALVSLSLLMSVHCRQTRDAVLAVYGLLLLGWLGVTWLGGPLRHLDPLWVLEPAWEAAGAIDLAEAGRRLLVSALLWGAIAAASLVVAGVRLLPLFRREMESTRVAKKHWFVGEREPLDDQPIRWREQHVEGLAPNPTLRRVPQWLGIVLVACLATASSVTILYLSLVPGATFVDVIEALMQLNVRKLAQLMPDASGRFLTQSIVVMLLGSLIVGVRCAGAITQERERHTWEAVLLTPISARQIALGKLWGVIRASYWYLLAYAAPAVSLSVLGGVLSLVYTLAWLAATVLAMYFIGAAGLWCSVRSTNSWKSLLQTMAFGYVGGLAIFVVTSPLIAVLALILLLLLLILDLILKTNMASIGFANMANFMRVFFFGAAGGLALAFLLLARAFISRVQRWIADRDRTRFWYDAPQYRRSRLTFDDLERSPPRRRDW
jgi:ABC-type transport system involved in multi-copper enzyme maturation permease subunit